MSIQSRKKDHVDLTVEGEATYAKTAGFEYYDFIHNALPEVDYHDIDISAKLLNRTFSMPLMVASMTGGYKGSTHINSIIAEVCEEMNIPFGVGSQRAMLEFPELIETFTIARQKAPNAFIAANIGGAQIRNLNSIDSIQRITDCIQANAIIIHLNPLQEMMQPDGDRSFTGILNGIRHLVKYVGLPVIVKETGAGISARLVQVLTEIGVSAVDISGAGGTSWAKVENFRTNTPYSEFNDWGIPTVYILESLDTLQFNKCEIIASGGIRSSFDIIKSICLGANFTAFAQPVISAAVKGGSQALNVLLNDLMVKLKITMLLLGCRTIPELGRHHLRKTANHTF